MKTKVFFLLPVFLMFFGCSSDNDTPEKETLKAVTYEVLLFEFTADTGNNSSRLHYEIKYNNLNNVAVKGSSKITMNYDGLIISPIKRGLPDEIAANSSFTESYDAEEPFNLNFGKINTVKLVSVEFIIAD
ncbi:hypothetical protein KHA90_13480 [Flavobacterium psychroterrae]|uniref:Lipoprotein n=1 Tax=Flavobacterium psychroterrae TaxID=2133767 RepID=A0ABS5PCM0_9FLAO|nr:hypothetical protein [Flavobacterium psychroterrae]MBS7232037.1 hypothetical protein [Flavobacterium psychroterrae]